MDGNHNERLLRIRAVVERVGLRRAALYKRIKAGHFPRPVRISAGAVAWPESEVAAWIAERIAQRDGES